MEILKDNSLHEKELFELIASGEAILLAGAGLSKIVGYPIWSELIKKLENAVREDIEDNGGDFDFRMDISDEDDLLYSQRLKDKLGLPRYSALMHKEFDDRRCDESHVRLMELPFRGVLTTNYDQTLETALFKINNHPNNYIVIDKNTTNREINKFFQALNFGFDGDKRIAHLHGIYNQASSLVLSLNDYIEKYSLDNPKRSIWTLHKRILWSLMATRRIVYIGFSMKDPFFQMMHQIVSEDLGNFGSKSHFMISRFSKDDDKEEYSTGEKSFANRIKRNYGIQTVFFDDDQGYDGLRRYIIKMSNDIKQLLGKKSNNEIMFSFEPKEEPVSGDSKINLELKPVLQRNIDRIKGV